MFIQRMGMSLANTKHQWAVVLAGGEGTRLQQLTSYVAGDSRPKQFCHLFGGKSLLAHTCERIAPLFYEDRRLFAVTRAHERFYREEFDGRSPWLTVIQPANRGTAVAMLLCLQVITREDPDAVVSFFPSDHHYSDCSAFRESLASGLRLISEYPDCILIVGAEARYPEVEYGWIRPGRTLVDSLVRPLLRVSRFWEKPSPRRAEMLQQQGCLWNTFVTMGRAGAFIDLLHATVPELTRLSARSFINDGIDRLYNQIVSVDFSRAVLTRMPKRLVVLRDAASGWTDLGSPRRVIDVLLSQSVRPAWLRRLRANALDTFYVPAKLAIRQS